MLFCAGLIGGKARRSAMETVKMSFGQKGSLLFSLLNILQLVGWTGIMIYDGALAANEILNAGNWLWCLVIGGLIVLWFLIGIKNLGKVNTVAMAALFVMTIVLSFVIFGKGSAIFTGESDIARIMVKAGLGIVGLLIVVLSTVTTTFLDAYSAGISSESVSAKLSGKWVAVAAAVMGTLGAILFPMENITDFLYLIGSVFAPMIAIQIADFFLLKKDYSGKAFDPNNLIVWVIGFVIYRFLMRVDIPVGNTLPDMVVTMLLCLAAGKLFPRKAE